MNTEAVAEMLEAYLTQEALLKNHDVAIRQNMKDGHTHEAFKLYARKLSIKKEQKAIYLMMVDEYNESIEIDDVLYDIYIEHITTEMPKGFG